jgi:hypothetical protein
VAPSRIPLVHGAAKNQWKVINIPQSTLIIRHRLGRIPSIRMFAGEPRGVHRNNCAHTANSRL